MAWSMPTTGQWNPGISMAPDMNMGAYTPEQWALMQQQNWQQWAQWQQQYAQWQSQYGDKYAQQMQTFQVLAGAPPMPPPSSAVPPPAPPPPEKPPPPPHENDQPLYGNNQKQNTSVPPPVPSQNNVQAGYNSHIATGNNQNWSYTANVKSDIQQSIQSQSGNTEALKKLAEEERSFDIQFKKWEEEIDKWRKENVNHPDKQAYKQYEQKFEACRVQLLERRRQMNLKRARLMANTTQVTNTTNTGNISTAISPQLQNTNTTNYPQTVPPNKQTQKNIPVHSHTVQNVPQYQQFNNTPEQGYIRNNNKTIDPQDRYDSYQPNEEYNTSPQSTGNFLPTSQSKGIPGLDLVPEIERSSSSKQQDVIDITDEKFETSLQQQKPREPDYSKISKGINNILGDEKIMNILSMVTNQRPSGNNDAKQNVPGHYRQDNISQYNINYQSDDYNARQEMSYNHNVSNYSNIQEQANSDYTEPSYQRYEDSYAREDFRQDEMAQDQYYDGYNRNMPLKSGPPSVRPNMAPSRPLITNLPNQQNCNENFQGGFERRQIQDSIKPVIKPTIPKWVDEPLFTPSIIVDYEHKSLRLKARGFIEPVHMFDYNHKSKDGEGSHKKDFEREIDDLFTRKPRRSDINDDWNNSTKYSERRPFRDDQRDRSKLTNRDDRDIYNRRMDYPYEERRRDDRDRFSRDDYERRDRAPDYERSRDSGREREFGRDRDMGRDRDFGRERDLVRDQIRERDREQHRERDLGRDRDFARDRDLGRDRDFARDRDLGRDRNIGKERDPGRDRDTCRYRDFRKDDSRNRSRSRDRDSRKREHSKDDDSVDSLGSKKTRESKDIFATSQDGKPHIVMIDDLLEPPGRDMRPEKIVIILRGPPGSGKSYLAKLIRDKEAEHGGTVRIMSIDDYFMQEGEIEEKDPATGKVVKKPSLKYEYDEKSEEAYLTSLKRAFKRSITDGYFTFLIFDSVNEQLKSYADVWNFSRQNGFQVYICTMELDSQLCFKRNIHNRCLEDIEVIVSRFFPTPAHHIQLDATTLLQNASITDVQMEDADDVTMEDIQNTEVESSFTSKWEKMDDAAQLARLDGTSKPLRPSRLSMEDYLQLDEWTPNTAKPGKKSVRWADIEERRQQEKMRAIGFVVGQTDWNRMTDPTMGSSALTQTKYIERVRKF